MQWLIRKTTSLAERKLYVTSEPRREMKNFTKLELGIEPGSAVWQAEPLLPRHNRSQIIFNWIGLGSLTPAAINDHFIPHLILY